MSSDQRPGDAERSRQLGLAGYAAKPVDKADLLRFIRQAIRVETKSEPRATEAFTGKRKLRILAAEDAQDNRVLIMMYLKTTAHSLTFVGNGQEALESRAAGDCDLILMDMQMPVMDGLEATRAIRELERQRGLDPVPIIALTANASPKDIENSWEAGCNGHLTKPIRKVRLLHAIEEYTSLGDMEDVAPSPGANADAAKEFDGRVKGLVPEYVGFLREYARRARSLFDEGDLAALAQIGHKVKGSAAIYGFGETGKIFGALEVAAKTGNRDLAGRLLAEGERTIALIPDGASGSGAGQGVAGRNE